MIHAFDPTCTKAYFHVQSDTDYTLLHVVMLHPSQVSISGTLIVDFSLEEKPRITSWYFHIKDHMEYIPRCNIATAVSQSYEMCKPKVLGLPSLDVNCPQEHAIQCTFHSYCWPKSICKILEQLIHLTIQLTDLPIQQLWYCSINCRAPSLWNVIHNKNGMGTRRHQTKLMS